MRIGEFVVMTGMNLLVIAGAFWWQRHSVLRKLTRVKAEIQELEDLVVAMIDELQETASESDAAEQPVDRPSGEEPPVSAPTEITSAFEPEETSAEPVLPPSPGTRQEQILDLWRQGITVEEIARRLQTGKGEVQLVLGLYRKG